MKNILSVLLYTFCTISHTEVVDYNPNHELRVNAGKPYKAQIPLSNLTNSDYNITSIKTVAPNYPKMAAFKRTQGFVELEFNVYKDGSVKDIIISKEYPKAIFSKASVDAISKYRFSIKLKDNVVQSHEYQASTQRLDFKLAGNFNTLTNEELENINLQLTLSRKGNIIAQHKFTTYFYTVPFNYNSEELKTKQVQQWLRNSAQNGFSDSQYYIGLIVYNNGTTQKESQMGFDWMVKAAQSSHAKSQIQLYTWINFGFIENTTNKPANYWLNQAAKNGSLKAKFQFAKNKSTENSSNKKQIKLAIKYINEYAKKYGKLPQYYQIKALLQYKLNKRSKALLSINKAINSATIADWDLIELKQQKSMILQE